MIPCAGTLEGMEFRGSKCGGSDGLGVAVIPNGIDTNYFKPLPRNNALSESLSPMNEGRLKESEHVIGFAGELREKKDCNVSSMPTRRSTTKIQPRY